MTANRVTLNPEFPSIRSSDLWYEKARNLIPGVTQTLAKGPTQYVAGVAPKYLKRGKGARVTDVDGNEYLDFTMGVGPVVLGYCDKDVDRAISAQLEQGITFSLMHPLEVEVAELVRRLVPGAEMVRFSKTGADVTSAAVRLARAFTGRERVLCCGYHGWHDWYIGTTSRSRGVPESTRALTQTFPYNDLDAIDSLLDESVACVILEPVIFEEPRGGFLAELKQLCARRGALLVFDEMWTGFRVAIGGAQQRYGVTADLACFSKAVANGMPLALLTGRREIMQLLTDDVFFYTTFGGEALSLAAAQATLSKLVYANVPAVLEERGRRLIDGYNRIAQELGLEFTRTIGLGCRSLVVFDAAFADPLLLKSFVQQELLRYGILWSGFHNLCFAHQDSDIAYLLDAYAAVLADLKRALAGGTVQSRIRGQLVQPVFRKTR